MMRDLFSMDMKDYDPSGEVFSRPQARAIIIHDDNSECMVIIEPNDELKQAIKTVFPRKVVEYQTRHIDTSLCIVLICR